MIIGNGQLAKAFMNSNLEHKVLCIFASGVSNSNCTEEKDFLREENLLTSVLLKNQDKKLIYFSSCALSSENYHRNLYYHHKQRMENIIQSSSKDYLIFRIPQLFGELKRHNTLINFLYESILEGRDFKLYDGAYRYVIEINDVVELVQYYIQHGYTKKILNLANPYRYRVEEIVRIFELLLNKKACYELVEKLDSYELDFSDFMPLSEGKFSFGESYLLEKLKYRVNEARQDSTSK